MTESLLYTFGSSLLPEEGGERLDCLEQYVSVLEEAYEGSSWSWEKKKSLLWKCCDGDDVIVLPYVALKSDTLFFPYFDFLREQVDRGRLTMKELLDILLHLDGGPPLLCVAVECLSLKRLKWLTNYLKNCCQEYHYMYDLFLARRKSDGCNSLHLAAGKTFPGYLVEMMEVLERCCEPCQAFYVAHQLNDKGQTILDCTIMDKVGKIVEQQFHVCYNLNCNNSGTNQVVDNILSTEKGRLLQELGGLAHRFTVDWDQLMGCYFQRLELAFMDSARLLTAQDVSKLVIGIHKSFQEIDHQYLCFPMAYIEKNDLLNLNKYMSLLQHYNQQGFTRPTYIGERFIKIGLLHRSIEKHHFQIMQFLLKWAKAFYINPLDYIKFICETREQTLETPMQLAISCNNQIAIQTLLQEMQENMSIAQVICQLKKNTTTKSDLLTQTHKQLAKQLQQSWFLPI